MVQWELPPPPTQPQHQQQSPLQQATPTATTEGTDEASTSDAGSSGAGGTAPVQLNPNEFGATAATSSAATAARGATAAAAVAAGGGGVKGVPRTSVEFEAAWRGLGGDVRRQAAYLTAIPPAALPSIFKNILTAPLLASLIQCLMASMAPALPAAPPATHPPPAVAEELPSSPGGAAGTLSASQGVALLQSLTRVARFDIMVMSVPSKERVRGACGVTAGMQRAGGRWRGCGGSGRCSGDVAAKVLVVLSRRAGQDRICEVRGGGLWRWMGVRTCGVLGAGTAAVGVAGSGWEGQGERREGWEQSGMPACSVS